MKEGLLHIQVNQLPLRQIGFIMMKGDAIEVWDYQINFLFYKWVLHIGFNWPK